MLWLLALGPLSFFLPLALALLRFPCAQLVTERLDPLVTPGKVSPHLHQIVGGVRSIPYVVHRFVLIKFSGFNRSECVREVFLASVMVVWSQLTATAPASTSLWIQASISRKRRRALPVDSKKTNLIIGPRFYTSSTQTALISGYVPPFSDLNKAFLRNEQVPQIANGGTGNSNGGMTVYYIQPAAGVPFVSFRKGFRMITGDPMVRSDAHVIPNSVQSYALSFRCYDGVPGSDWAYAPGVGPFESVGLPKTMCPGGIRTNIFFPTCWDGISLDTPDHHSHVRYLDGQVNPRAGIFYQNGTCPSTHPVRIPLIFLETIWNTRPFLNDWPTDGSQPLVYSMGDPTGFGQHADYVFGWEDDSLDRAMAHCNDRGDFPADCKELTILTDEEINTCTQPAVIDEVTEGTYLPALPGCNPIQEGPGTATMISSCTAVSTTGKFAPSSAASPATPTEAAS
ncbi:hypothetical protein NMY22_g2587 [Coprinellus aureogranulatus]|nr:hypothetical protein NMY22_g2587 [Coprinellus aureogranulatus]